MFIKKMNTILLISLHYDKVENSMDLVFIETQTIQ